jgi:hypothetical protein
MQAVGSPQILPFLRERIRKPRQATHPHSDGQVLTLHMGRADLLRVRVAHDWDSLRVRHVGRTVPVLAFGIVDVHLDELRKVATVAQSSGDRLLVGLKSIRGDLEPLRGSRGPQTLDEYIRGGVVPGTEREVQNEFRFPLDGDKAVRIADAVVVGFRGPSYRKSS